MLHRQQKCYRNGWVKPRSKIPHPSRKIELQKARLANAVRRSHPQGAVGVGEHHGLGHGASRGAALRQLAQSLGLDQLSMGMSDDFEVAVEEGATMVRIGTAIFGPRP